MLILRNFFLKVEYTIENIGSNITVLDCLVHEDCEVNEFCSPPPENKCVDACTLDGEETFLTVSIISIQFTF